MLLSVTKQQRICYNGALSSVLTQGHSIHGNTERVTIHGEGRRSYSSHYSSVPSIALQVCSCRHSRAGVS